MRSFLLASIALLSVTAAQAADIKVLKAKQRVLVSYMGCGTFYGIESFAQNEKVEVSGQSSGGLGGTFAVGAAVGPVFGYMCGDGTAWKAISFMASYKNIGTSGVSDQGVAGSVNSKWSFTQRFEFGGPITAVLNLLPNMGTLFPALPNLTGFAPGAHPYLFVAVHQDDEKAQLGADTGRGWTVKGGFGAGMRYQLGNAQSIPGASAVVANTWIEYIPAGKSVSLSGGTGLPGAASAGRETRIGFGIEY